MGWVGIILRGHEGVGIISKGVSRRAGNKLEGAPGSGEDNFEVPSRRGTTPTFGTIVKCCLMMGQLSNAV